MMVVDLSAKYTSKQNKYFLKIVEYSLIFGKILSLFALINDIFIDLN